MGLSELTAECSLSFGNCLWVSCIYFFHLNVSKVGRMPMLPSVGMFEPVCGRQRLIWMTLTCTDLHHLSTRFNERIHDLLICGTISHLERTCFLPSVTHESQSLFFALVADGASSVEVSTAAVRQRSGLLKSSVLFSKT